jgi:hypothetical protein
VRDPVAVRLDCRIRPLLVLEEVERRLRPVPVRDVPERLSAALGVETAFQPLRVRLERPDDGRALRGLARLRARNELCDVTDLLLAEVALERRHAAAAALHLPDDLVEGRARFVQVRPDRPVRARRLERVTVSAVGFGEDLGTGTAIAVSAAVIAAAAAGRKRDESERDKHP